MTEDSYRAEIEQKLKENKLYASFASDEDPSDADMLQYAQMYATAYDGSKRSSHILFNSDDEATAQEVLDKLNSGELDFVDAVKEYSQDPVLSSAMAMWVGTTPATWRKSTRTASSRLRKAS